MTEPDYLPIQAKDLERRTRTAQGLRPLREALVFAQDQAAQLRDDGDVDALAFGYAELKLLHADLKTLIGDIEQMIVEVAPTESRTRAGEERTYYLPFTVDGVANFEVLRRAASASWDSEELLRRVVAGALYGGTGEVPSEEAQEVLDRVLEALRAAVPFTASLGWRITALREQGIDPDDYRETRRPAGHSLKMTGQRKDEP